MMKRWMVLTGAVGLVAASGLLALGCGKDNEVTTGQVGYRDANVAENASTRSVESKPEVVPAVTSSPVNPTPEPANDMQVAGSTAPDLLAKVSKEIVSRGETVDITAEGSPDVVEMMLSDGYGTTRSLTFEAESNTWKTSYRVPLNMKLERLGLSVKARNDENRWRRVWVFLSLPENAAKAAPESSAQSDSVSQ